MRNPYWRYFFFAIFVLFIIGCVDRHVNFESCASMKIGGWSNLLEVPPFRNLQHYQESPINPISEKSKLSLSDSNYAYTLLLNYYFSYPGISANRLSVENRCISEVNLLVKYPVDKHGTLAVSNFIKFMSDNEMPLLLTHRINDAYQKSTRYASLGQFSGVELFSGVIDHKVRGMFFLIDIKSID
jgi:hypothetical protein